MIEQQRESLAVMILRHARDQGAEVSFQFLLFPVPISVCRFHDGEHSTVFPLCMPLRC